MKTALIMEGGAMRGLFTCGITDVLAQAGIRFDGGAGISAGACFGCNVKSHQPGRALRYNKTYCRDPRYASLRSLLRTGDLYGADFCYRELPDVLDPFDRAAFAADPMEFLVGAVDADTGEMVYHTCTDGGDEDIQWIRASASMPLVSRPVRIGERRLLDGGVVESIPLSVMEERGYDRFLVILTRPADYVKRPGRFAGLTDFALRHIFRLPRTADALRLRPERYNAQVAHVRELEKAGRAFVLCPPAPLPVHQVERDPSNLQAAYDIGASLAREALPGIRAFLEDR